MLNVNNTFVAKNNPMPNNSSFLEKIRENAIKNRHMKNTYLIVGKHSDAVMCLLGK
jgi:cobalamin biosynthesis Co2+ chelatase CbiK